jgi:hypothetical protein
MKVYRNSGVKAPGTVNLSIICEVVLYPGKYPPVLIEQVIGKAPGPIRKQRDKSYSCQELSTRC